MEVSGTVLITLIALAVVSYVSYRWGFSRELAPTASPELPAPRLLQSRGCLSRIAEPKVPYVSALHDRLSAALGERKCSQTSTHWLAATSRTPFSDCPF